MASKPSPVLLVIGGGVTLVGATLGTVFLMKANTALDESSRDRAALPATNACFGASGQTALCTGLRNANVAVDRDRNIATTSFIVGGAAAVGSLVYWLWPRAEAPSGHVGAIVGPGYAAVKAGWSW
jgi:hypothetical protein